MGPIGTDSSFYARLGPSIRLGKRNTCLSMLFFVRMTLTLQFSMIGRVLGEVDWVGQSHKVGLQP